MDIERSSRAIHDGLKQLLQAPVDSSKAEKAEKKRQLEEDLSVKRRGCNREFFLRIYAQLAVGCGINLATLLPKHRVGALSPVEERRFRLVHDPVVGRSRRRSFIVNTLTREQRFEVPMVIKEGRRQNPTWHKVADMGSVGRPAMMWWLYRAGERGALLWDRPHRIMCDIEEGEKEAGVMLTKLSWNAVLRLRVQPFGKGDR